MDLQENWAALGHKACRGFCVSPESCCQFSFTIPINVKRINCSLQKRTTLSLHRNRTGENCLPRRAKRKHRCLSKSLARRLRAMPRTYCRKSRLTTTSHPFTSTKSLRIWKRYNYEQHFTTELVPITMGRGNLFDQFNPCCCGEHTMS